MNSSAIKAITTATVFGLVGIFVLVSVLTGQGNQLAHAYLFLAVAGFVIGLSAPKSAIFPILFLTVTVDMLKRFMVVYGRTYEEDLYWIMGLAPLILGGILVNMIFGHLWNRRRLEAKDWKTFAVSTLLFLALTGSEIIASGVSGRALGNAVNGGFYWYLIFVIPILFDSVEERAKLLRSIPWLFVPVAAYMFVHYYHGLLPFEIEYSESGLSLEGRILEQNEGVLNGVDGGMRGFSTMSGASVVSTMLSVLTLLVAVPLKQRVSIPEKVLRVGIIVLFICAAYFTLTRKGWICGVAAVSLYWMFRWKLTTIMGYVGAVFLFLLVVAASPAIIKYRLLDEFQITLSEITGAKTVSGQKALILGTMYDRFRGWENLSDPLMWTPFGFKAAGMERELDAETATRKWGHDITTDLLIKLGYVPLIFLGAGGIYVLYWLHRNIFQIPAGSMERKMCILCLALALGISAGAFANSEQMNVFPQNFYIYLFAGVVVTTILDNRARIRDLALQPRERHIETLDVSSASREDAGRVVRLGV